MAGFDFKSAIGKVAAKEKSAPPSPVPGPYRAAHTPGRPDNEWEVRDGDGILVKQVAGSDFEAARRRCVWLAGKLNEAYARGAMGRKGK